MIPTRTACFDVKNSAYYHILYSWVSYYCTDEQVLSHKLAFTYGTLQFSVFYVRQKLDFSIFLDERQA
jgi:hypothetical protein